MPRTEWPALTPSRLGDLTCARRFHALYVLGTQAGQRRFGNGFGAALHDVLARLYDRRLGANIPHLSHLEPFTRVAAAAHADTAEQRDELAASIKDAACGYVGNDDDLPEETLAVEQIAEASLLTLGGNAPILLRARFDRLVCRQSQPDTLVVRDYKTGRRRGCLEEATIMLAVARAAFPKYASVVLELDWIGDGGRTERQIVRPSDLKGIYPYLRQRALLVYGLPPDSVPAPEPGVQCEYCALRSTCQPGTTLSLIDMDRMFGYETENEDDNQTLHLL